MDTLEGYSALVTAGAQGIGKAITVRLLAAGMQVLALDADAEACSDLQEQIGLNRLQVRCGDVADEPVLKAAVAQADACGKGLKAIVSNAGIGKSMRVTELGLADWNRVLAVNLTAAFLLAKHGAAALKRNYGAMVTIASSRAVQSEANTEAYSASKGGLVALTHALAISLGPEVRVNCVSPGWIATDAWKKSSQRRQPQLRAIDDQQHPVGHVGRPEDVAAMVSFLLSAEAGFITGAHFLVDGGMTRKMIYV